MKLQGMIGAGVMMVGVCGMAASAQCQSGSAKGCESTGEATMVQASWAPEAKAAPQSKAGWGETKNIVEVAASAGTFNTLIAAAKAAGLAETLMGEGPFTVFAPTDEAFAALGSTVTDLLKPENKAKLASILTYHVVPGRVYADQVAGMTSVTTVNGAKAPITAKGDWVKIGGAKVVSADIEASNGVIHVIDAVILPE